MESSPYSHQYRWDEIWASIQKQPPTKELPAICLEDLWEEKRWMELVPLTVRDLVRAARSGNIESEAENLECLAFLLGELELFDEAIVVQKNGLALLREVGEVAEIAAGLSRLGRYQAPSSSPEAAILVYKEAIEIREELGGCDDIVYDLANLGALLGRLGRWLEALGYLEQALLVAPPGTEGWCRASILASISEVQVGLGDVFKAIWYQREAAETFLAAGDLIAAADHSVRLGQLHAQAGLPADGRALIMNAIMALERLGEERKAATAACAMWDMD